MWPKRYFGARYYAFRYFPQSAAAATPPPPALTSSANIAIGVGL